MTNLCSMVFAFANLQIGNRAYNLWFILEILIIIGVIIFQLIRSRTIYLGIDNLEEIFEYPLKVTSGFIEKESLNKSDDPINKIAFTQESEGETSTKKSHGKNIVKVSIIETSGENSAILRIKDAINTYLLSNYGAAVNFSIIKDIIDREIDVQDEEISQDIPTPLYSGLAATMIGIIFGLISMPGLDGDKFTLGINSLIDGVKVAMTASLFGLLCTTYFSSFHYKSAKKKILSDKNAQISYLQAKLLPELIKAEDTGVSGLKASLDRFALVATEISDNVLIAANQTGENIVLQQEVIDKVSNLDIIKISETNLQLFKRLEDNMGALQKFSEYLSSMNQISNNLKEFAFRTLDVNRIANKIDTGLEENNRLSKFLTSHFEKIESAGNAARKAVDIADITFKDSIDLLKEGTKNFVEQAIKEVNLSSSAFKSAIENLKEETTVRISLLNQNATNNESKLREIYSDIGTKLELITSQHLNQIQSAYSNAIPQFNQLSNLETLPKIQEQVTDGVSKLQNESNVNNTKLIDSINQLNTSLNDLKANLNNTSILTKLDSFEINYQKQISDGLFQMQKESNVNTDKLVDTINQLNSSLNVITGDFKKQILSEKGQTPPPSYGTTGPRRKSRDGFWRRLQKRFRPYR